MPFATALNFTGAIKRPSMRSKVKTTIERRGKSK